MKQCVLLFLILFFSKKNIAQYVVNGSANSINCHCYNLTPELNNQSGSVWNSNKIDLNNPFDFSFDIFFGCLDANGADGLAFILQPISTSVGSSGGGLGFQGITPSIGILMDTWQNTSDNDPTYDHISIHKNGDINHNSANALTPPVQIISGNDNAEDCAWHVGRFTWDPVTKLLTAYIDGVFRTQTTIDLINNIFSGNPMVYWGFTASTGGSYNLQKFCTRLNTQINFNSTSNNTCIGTPIIFTSVIDAFVPITNYFWDFGDGTSSTLQNPPSHLYNTAGQYYVKFIVKAIDGCESDTTTQIINVGNKPIVSFTVNDTCVGNPIYLNSTASIINGSISNYVWIVDGIVLANSASIINSSFSLGNHIVKHYVVSNNGCVSDSVFDNFTIFAKPATPSFTTNDTCIGSPTIIKSNNVNALLQSNWLIDGVAILNTNTITNNYSVGTHAVSHFLKTNDGCVSDTAFGTFNVFDFPTATINSNDTCLGKPVNLQCVATGTNLSYQWFVDGTFVSTNSNYTNSNYTIGLHNVKCIIKSNNKCSITLNKSFTILNKPIINGSTSNVCTGVSNLFVATLNNPPINGLTYTWLFNDNTTLNGQTVNKTFNTSGNGIAKLIAKSTVGCNSDTSLVNYTVYNAYANAGNDTLVVKNQQFNLNGSSNGISYDWQPSIYLNNNLILNPTAILTADQIFTLNIKTVEGCTATDNVYIKVYTGSKIYVPSVFTPNGDGVNDILLPTYIGIKEIKYFNIYNRWGQQIFTTTNQLKGWDSYYKNKKQPNENYIFIIKAIDVYGKEINVKGNVFLLK